MLAAGQIGVMNADKRGVTEFVQSILNAGSLHEELLYRDLFLASSILNDDVGVKRSLEQEVGRKTGESWSEKRYLDDSIH